MKLRLGSPYWLDVFDGRPPRYAAFRGRARYDVVIVGGGVTGCASAYFFAKAGARVAVIERARLGRGSTAASTALLMQEPDSDFGPLAERYGRAAARRVWMRSAAAVRDMRRTLRSIRAPAVAGRPSVYYAPEDYALPKLRREFAMRRRAGVICHWLDAGHAEHALGFPAPGAILTPGNTEVDPYRACLALVRAARHAGADFFEHSAADACAAGVWRDNDLQAGTLAADWAVIATGYATREFKPLAGHFTMLNTYVVATPRLSREVRGQVGLDDVMVWDTGRPYHYMRWTPDGRILFGGGDRAQAPRPTRPSVLAQRTAQLGNLNRPLSRARRLSPGLCVGRIVRRHA